MFDLMLFLKVNVCVILFYIFRDNDTLYAAKDEENFLGIQTNASTILRIKIIYSIIILQATISLCYYVVLISINL